MSGAGGGGAGGGGPPPTGLRPPSKLRRPTTLTSGPGPGPSSVRPSPLGSGGSGARTPLSAASSLSALNDKSETGGPFNSGNADDFIIGDRVWVNGTKPGYIQFLGETQFSSGDWAGVVLDEPVGKNDGSVNGVRYFQCEPKRGVFARPERLSRFPGPGANGTNTTATLVAPGKTQVTTTRVSSPTGSTRSSPRAVTMHTSSTMMDYGLRVGDRVIVNASSGMKAGTLRFMGPTEFATGQWAGVELDDPVGKNDGSVAGKKYFRCPARHGLFAPLHKVAREGGHTSTTTTTTTRTTRITSQPRRAGSQESLHSSLSSASARAGVRLGVAALTSPAKVMTPRPPRCALSHRPRPLNRTFEGRWYECRASVRLGLASNQREQAAFVSSMCPCWMTVGAEKLSALSHSCLVGVDSPEVTGLGKLQSLSSQLVLLADMLISLVINFCVVVSLVCRSSDWLVNQLVSGNENGKLPRYSDHVLAMTPPFLAVAFLPSFLSDCLTLCMTLFFPLEQKLQCTSSPGQSFGSRLLLLLFLSSNLALFLHAALTNSPCFLCLFWMTVTIFVLRYNKPSHMRRPHRGIKSYTVRAVLVQSERNETRTAGRQFSAHHGVVNNAHRHLPSFAILDHNPQVARSIRKLGCFLLKYLEEHLFLSERSLQRPKYQENQHVLRHAIHLLSSDSSDPVASPGFFSPPQAREEASEERRLRERERERTDLSAQTSDQESQLASARGELDRLRAEFSSHKEDLTRQLRQNQEETMAVNRMHDQMKNQLGKVEELQRLLAEAEDAKSNLATRVSQLETELAAAATQAANQKADGNNEAEVKALKDRIEELQNRQRQLSSTEEELRGELERTRGRAEEDRRKLSQLSKEMERLERELERGQLGQSVVESLEADKRQLEAKIAELRAMAPANANGKSVLVTSLGGSSTGEGDHEAIKEERDSLQMQVEFLNSIIVDMQRKNDELKTQVEVLKAGPDLDDVDINLNGIKGMAPPRLFCDICDRFDVHDTADCPIQCSIEEEMTSHSHHSVARHSSRPYCEVCEVFGHTSAECDPSETF
ncbi:unnamed protein product [Ixodes hexagonus]